MTSSTEPALLTPDIIKSATALVGPVIEAGLAPGATNRFFVLVACGGVQTCKTHMFFM